MEVEVPGAGYGFTKASLSFLFLLLLTGLSGAAAFVGVNVDFPAGGDGLPRAEHVVDLLNILQIQQIKLREDVHPSLLHALSGSGLQVVVTLPRRLVPSLADSIDATSDWLCEHVLRFLPATNVTGVVVGDRTSAAAPPPPRQLVTVMRNVHSCLRLAGLDTQIKVTSSVSSDIINTPSSATFMLELFGFLSETNSPLMINVEPYARGHPVPPPSEVVDGALHSAYTAMHSLGYSHVPVVIGSIGWPWKAAPADTSASPEMATTFNDKLVKHVLGTEVHVYIHELIDVSLVGEDVSSARYGVFSNTLSPRYRLDVKTEGEEPVMRRVLADGTTGNGTSTGGGTGQYCVAKPNTADNILSVGLNWACGQGNTDCTPIQQNGPCFLPDTYASHASYAFNSYYQKNAGAGATCDFNGAAQLVTTDPSYNSCIYTSSTGSGGGGGGGGAGSVGSGPSSNGILQPFNPPGNNSGASSVGVNVLVSVMVLATGVFWSWRH